MYGYVRSTNLSLRLRLGFAKCFQSGSHLLSHTVSSIVSSAAWGLTIVFGMGTGVSPRCIATGTLFFQLSSCYGLQAALPASPSRIRFAPSRWQASSLWKRLRFCALVSSLTRHSRSPLPHPALDNQTVKQPLLLFPRKEVIQPHLPIRLPCYDFTPVIRPAFGSSLR